MRFEDLRTHVPHYFGRPTVSDVLDSDEASIASAYHLDCCLELEYIPGECLKFYELPDEAVAVQLLRRFDGKVAYHFDGSFFNWNDPARIKVIDFAPTA
jgi:hypothetical protein